MRIPHGILLFISTVLTLGSHAEAATDNIFCYYGAWATYRPGNGHFPPEKIDAHLCTHVIYTFVGLSASGEVQVLDPYLAWTLDALNRVVQLKQTNPRLKVLVAMGGWNEGSATYSLVAADPALRDAMADSVLAFLQRHRFDGFDLDWEYPGMRGGAPADKQNFVALLRTLQEKLHAHGYLLTAAVGVTETHIQNAYDVAAMAPHLDYIHLMTYDLHAYWDHVTGQNAPLYPSSLESWSFAQLTVDVIVRNWIGRGAPPEKLVLGIPLYGHSFRLSSSASHGLGAPTSGPGDAGPYTQEPGTYSYLEICEKLPLNYTTVWDEEQMVPYAYKGSEWIGYDDPESVLRKALYAREMQLGGVMVWSLESDDAWGVCGQGEYPLMNAIRQGLGSTPTVTVTTAPTTTSTTTKAPLPTTTTSTKAPAVSSTTTKAPLTPASFTCRSLGNYRDPVDCNIYYVCADAGNGKFLTYHMKCGSGLYFDQERNVCNYPYAVQGC